MNKKGAELTLNVVIVAIILLITVGVVISFLFSQQTKTSTALNDCESKRGECMTKEECKNKGGTKIPFECKNSNDNICCLVFGK